MALTNQSDANLRRTSYGGAVPPATGTYGVRNALHVTHSILHSQLQPVGPYDMSRIW